MPHGGAGERERAGLFRSPRVLRPVRTDGPLQDVDPARLPGRARLLSQITGILSQNATVCGMYLALPLWAAI